jgi:hypothetical protein
MSQLLNRLHHHQLTKPPNAHYHPSQASLEECQTASKHRNKNSNRKVRKRIGRIRIELTSEKVWTLTILIYQRSTSSNAPNAIRLWLWRWTAIALYQFKFWLFHRLDAKLLL